MRARLAATASLSAATLIFLFACGHKKPAVSPEPPVTETISDAGDDDAGEASTKSLFDRLGGNDGIGQVVDAFIKNIQADRRVSHAFAHTKGPRLTRFRAMLVDQLCELAGGECKYGGKDMKAAHKGMHVTNAQFDALVEDLQLAMAELKVPDDDQNEVVKLLAPMREDIVSGRR